MPACSICGRVHRSAEHTIQRTGPIYTPGPSYFDGAGPGATNPWSVSGSWWSDEIAGVRSDYTLTPPRLSHDERRVHLQSLRDAILADRPASRPSWVDRMGIIWHRT